MKSIQSYKRSQMALVGSPVSGSVATLGGGKIGPTMQEENNTTITLRITRQTANIAQNLPVPLFGSIHSADLYNQFLSPYITGGTVISALTSFNRSETAVLGRTGNLQISFTNGVNTDILTVACDAVPYNTLLLTMLTDAFSIQGLRFQTPVANVSQLDLPVYFVNRTGYGSSQDNNLTPSNFVNSYQNQPQIVEIGKEGLIPVNIPPMDSRRGMIVPIEQTAGIVYSITIGMNSRFLQ